MSISFCKSIHYDFAIGVECFFQTIHIGGYTTEIECKHQIFVAIRRRMLAYIKITKDFLEFIFLVDVVV